jgi:hypothetical protein
VPRPPYWRVSDLRVVSAARVFGSVRSDWKDMLAGDQPASPSALRPPYWRVRVADAARVSRTSARIVMVGPVGVGMQGATASVGTAVEAVEQLKLRPPYWRVRVVSTARVSKTSGRTVIVGVGMQGATASMGTAVEAVELRPPRPALAPRRMDDLQHILDHIDVSYQGYHPQPLAVSNFHLSADGPHFDQ